MQRNKLYTGWGWWGSNKNWLYKAWILDLAAKDFKSMLINSSEIHVERIKGEYNGNDAPNKESQ